MLQPVSQLSAPHTPRRAPEGGHCLLLRRERRRLLRQPRALGVEALLAGLQARKARLQCALALRQLLGLVRGGGRRGA